MFALPPALAPLARHRQFFPVRFVPDPSRPGKSRKFPVSAHTLQAADAHDPSIWLDVGTAAVVAEALGPGHGVGFTVTEDSGLFFLDLDECLTPGGGWSESAQALCAQFPGAAVEISHSGRGLHVIGRTRTRPSHGTRCGAMGAELYTGKRFVALTGTGAVGNVDTDHTEALARVAAIYFPPPESSGGLDWTEGPCADWCGPTDDDDLIRRALRSQSAGSIFGGRASFADLWGGNVEALARAYPDPSRAFDASAADAALAQHLAFWTGKDCARIERLMRRSALVRDKWDREDYLRGRTIPGAVGRQRDVLQDKPLPVVAPAAAGLPQGRLVSGETILSPQAQMALFAGCVYVVARHKVLVPGGVMLTPDRFKARFGGYTFLMDNRNERVSRDAFEAFTQSQALRCPSADDAVFRPDLPPMTLLDSRGRLLDGDTSRTYVNTWWPANVERQEGDASLFLEHLRKLLPVERDRSTLLAYLAAVAQYPGRKFTWMPLLQGVEGNGKTILSRAAAAAVGREYVHWPAAHKLSKDFNAWLEGRLLICIEDIYVPQSERHILERLKPMIAGGDSLEIEGKGVDQVSVSVCANFIANTNHKNGLPKGANDRRIAPFFCAQQRESDLKRDGMDAAYFRRLYGWLDGGGYEIVAEYLHTYPIPDEMNPALGGRAPHTSSTEEAIAAGRGVLEEAIQEAVEEGHPGFRGGWVSLTFLRALLGRLGRAGAISRSRLREILDHLGYVRHPALEPYGQTNDAVVPDGGKAVLYVLAGSPAALLRTAADAAAAYSRAQAT